MTTIKELVNRGCVEVFRRISMKRLQKNQTFETDWYDITNYVVTWPSITESFGDNTLLGDFKVASTSLVLDNSGQKFNDENNQNSLFYKLYFRRLTKIKIEVGYIDDDNIEVEGLVFYGVFYGNTKASDKETITIPTTGLLKVFDLFGAKGVAETSTTTQGMVSRLYGKTQGGVDLLSKFFEGSSINPDADTVVALTNASIGEDDTIWDKIQDYSIYNFFIPYVNNSGYFVWGNRTESATLDWEFNANNFTYKNDYPINVISIDTIDDGISNYYSKAVIEYSDGVYATSEITWTPGGDSTVDQYGERIYAKTALDLTAAEAQLFADNIVNNTRASRNYEITTPFIPTNIKSKVKLNAVGQETREYKNCFRLGESKLNSGDYLQSRSGAIDIDDVFCKVIKIGYNINSLTIKYLMREI